MPNDYGNMPFKNSQAAKSDRYARLTESRDNLVKSYTSGKGTPMGKKEYQSKLNALDQARMKADPKRFKESIARSNMGAEMTETTVGGQKTKVKDLTYDNSVGAKKRFN